MYLFEWGFQWSKRNMSYGESVQAAQNRQRRPGQPSLHPPENVNESVANSVNDNSSLYSHNAVFLDVRTPNDEKRGVITFFLGWIGGFLLYMLFAMGSISADKILAGHRLDGEPLYAWDYFFLMLMPMICVGAIFIYIRYALPYLRLESFTARRIIIRFNRVTRRVYLLRPRHLGGIRILDWDSTQIMVDKKMSELEGTGGFLILGWDKGNGSDLAGKPIDDIEIAFVGKPTRNASELLSFWEYIRRYMQEGPAAAPSPKKLINKFPWPWLSLKAAWRMDTQFFRHHPLWTFVLINVLLLPAVLIHAAGHWLSLLLCYEPKFPRAIEEAAKTLPVVSRSPRSHE